jgi:hypothetical protein
MSTSRIRFAITNIVGAVNPNLTLEWSKSEINKDLILLEAV